MGYSHLNLNLTKGTTSTRICCGLISPIHKEGPLDDPSNYRGICIMNSLLKLLCTILNDRLTEFSQQNNLISKEQIGFQKNCRTSDHIFTLKSIVNKYVADTKGKKIYVCFVDFKKAFDSVWHNGLFRKLENKGINGNFLNLIKSIYAKTKCAVKINGKVTNSFNYLKGVQQGNPLSSTLFNLFVNYIFDEIKNASPVSLNNYDIFNALVYADDLVLISTSRDDLQRSLDALQNYCEKWKLEINFKKTKALVFSKGTRVDKTPFMVQNNKIEITREYKYLGITINSKNCTFTSTLIDLHCNAKQGTSLNNVQNSLKNVSN